MSHFTGIVFVETSEAANLEHALDEILVPYCEDVSVAFEYSEFIDRTDEVLECAKEEEKDVEVVVDEYGYEKKDGRFGYYVNPDARWDWYSIGGRWNNMLLNKSGNSCNACPLADIDWLAMKEKFLEREKERFEEGLQMLQCDDPKSFKTKHLLPALCTVQNNVLYSWGNRVCAVWETFDEHLNQIGADVPFYIPVFCYVDDDDWNERGEMGWFGMASDLSDAAAWSHQISDWIEEHVNDIDRDWTLVVIDFHI